MVIIDSTLVSHSFIKIFCQLLSCRIDRLSSGIEFFDVRHSSDETTRHCVERNRIKMTNVLLKKTSFLCRCRFYFVISILSSTSADDFFAPCRAVVKSVLSMNIEPDEVYL